MIALELATEEHEGTVTIALKGELDLFSAKKLEAELERVEAREPPLIVLDLRELAFIDSSGLRVVLTADLRARERERRVVLVRAPEGVQRIFHIAGLDARLEMVDDPTHVL